MQDRQNFFINGQRRGRSAYYNEGADCEHIISGKAFEITATKVSIPALSVSCVVRQVTKFDTCPWGMIFRNRERARARRPFQINPVSPGYHIVLQCMSGSKQSETIGDDWVLERGGSILRGGVSRDYRCPWDRRSIAGAEVPVKYRGLWCSGKGYHYRCRDTTDEGFFDIRRDRINLSEEGDCRITAVTPTAKGHQLRVHCPPDVLPDPPDHVNLRLDARGRLHLD